MFKKPYHRPEKVYAGIGNRDTPDSILELITQIAKRLWKVGLYDLRTGAADGADQAFMQGTMRAEIYVPWHQYNGFPMHHAIPKEAERLALEHNPHWRNSDGKEKNITKGVKALHARNMMIISGPHLDEPVDFVLCFTRDGCDSRQTRTHDTGGTGSAISYADSLGVPIVNLAHKNSLEYLSLFSGVDFMDMTLPELVTGF